MNKPTEEKSGSHQPADMNKTGQCSHSFEGKVVSVAGDKLASTCNEGNPHSHTLAKDAKVTCDGKVCKAEDLKAGNKIRVTTKHDDKNIATHVESLNKHGEFAHSA